MPKKSSYSSTYGRNTVSIPGTGGTSQNQRRQQGPMPSQTASYQAKQDKISPFIAAPNKIDSAGIEQAALDDFMSQWGTPQQTQTRNPGSGSGRGRGGGGASGSQLAQSQYDMLLKLAQSGQMRSPTRTFTRDAGLDTRWADAVAADQRNMRGQLDGLDQFAANLSNPYDEQALMQGAGVDVSALQNLVGSQGGDDAGLRAQAEFMLGQNQADADAMNRQVAALSGGQDAWNQSVGTEAQLLRQFAEQSLAAQDRGGRAALDARAAAGQEKVDDQNFQQRLGDRQGMLSLIGQMAGLAGQGAKTGDIDFLKLLGSI